jgi:hypothetical protein
MRRVIEYLVRIALVAIVWFAGWRVLDAPLTYVMNLAIIAGGVLLVFPVVWLGRRMPDRRRPESGWRWSLLLRRLVC